jgi:hypothetical protein
MRLKSLGAIALSITACDKVEDTGTAGSLEPQLSGTISIIGQDAEGRVEVFHGFGIDQGGTVLMYLSSNPNLTCQDAAEMLGDHEGPFDLGEYIVGGTCDIFIRKDDYTGELSFTDDPFGRAGFTINCFTGDGSFEFENRSDGGDDGYYWSGRKWQGYPTVYSYSITGGSEAAYTVDLDLREYAGGFPDEGLDSYVATGDVVGTVNVEWCPELGRTPAFSGG